MFALTRRMLNGKNDDFLGRFVSRIVNKIRIFSYTNSHNL